MRSNAAAAGRAGSALEFESARDRILPATAALVRQRGLDGTTIASICQESGLPVSSIYWHFEDKDALFAEVLSNSYTQWLAAMPRWGQAPAAPEQAGVTPGPSGRTGTQQVGAQPAGTPAAGIQAVLEQVLASLQGSPDFLVVGMQLLLERRDQYQRARGLFVEIRAQMVGMISGWFLEALRTHPDPNLAESLSRLVLAFSDGVQVALQIDDEFDAQEYLRLFLDTFARAAALHIQRSAG